MSERSGTRIPETVVWHDLECGGYRADLPLWRELAGRFDGPVLDVGAGSGRVTLQLARDGRAVTALDRDERLLSALRARAAGLDVETVCADARAFELDRRDYALCVVPMQTIQLLGGAEQRISFLRCARAHVRPGGAIALAILGELDTFDCSHGGIGPAAERAYVDGLLYLSRAIRVSETAEHVQIERERRILLPETGADPRPIERSRVGAGAEFSSEPATAATPHDRGPQLDLIELDRVSARMLRREGALAGLRAQRTLKISATDEHVGSSVVMLGV